MSRRLFLQSSAATLVQAQAEEPKVRAALIIEPTGDHLSAYYRLALCRGLAEYAVCDPTGKTFAAAAKAAGDLRIIQFTDPVKLFDEFRPNLAVVSMEPLHMPPVAELALSRGAHVILEKPGCATEAALEKLAGVARVQGRELMLAMASRLYPAAVRAREIIASGALGRPFSVDMHWVADHARLQNPAYQKSWKSFKAQAGGGKLIFHGVHYLDLIRYLTGDSVTNVAAFCRNVGRLPIEVEDAAVVSMVFGSGMVGTLNTGYYIDRGYDNRIALWGPSGWLHFEPHLRTALTVNAKGSRDAFEQPEPAPVYDLMLQAAVDFARGLRAPFMTTADTLAVLRTVYAAYRAAETGVAQTVRS